MSCRSTRSGVDRNGSSGCGVAKQSLVALVNSIRLTAPCIHMDRGDRAGSQTLPWEGRLNRCAMVPHESYRPLADNAESLCSFTMEFRRRVCMGVYGDEKRGALCQSVPEERDRFY